VNFTAHPWQSETAHWQGFARDTTKPESRRLRDNRIKTILWSLTAGLCLPGAIFGQALTHGPVVGGVTDSSAKAFVRTDQETSVAIWYGTDPNLGSYLISDTFQTSATDDFTSIVPLTGLSSETTYYLNFVVNGIPNLTSPPYPTSQPLLQPEARERLSQPARSED